MRRLFAASVVGIFIALVSLAAQRPTPAAEPAKQKVYELRTYYVLPGRMPAMLKRFREHTTKIFEKHGMENVGYWTPEGNDADSKLIYLLAHDSKEAAEKSWQAFGSDPEWKRVQAESEKDGKIVEKVERVFLKPTDFSKLR